MVVNKRKKSSRSHGTHGWGRNKHRNSGQRGGYGNAGSGKKSDSKKPSIWGTKTDYFGKHGFVSKGQITKDCVISVRDLEDKLPAFIAQKHAKQEAGVVVIDLTKLGYTKLLGTGKVTKKIKITIPTTTAGAAEKIKAAGGEVVAE
jgi:large subunit ribosomal protein L15